MRESDLGEIRELALHLVENGKSWHFHILTPNCVFNERDQYAFILENITDSTSLVHYSDRAEKDLGSDLAPMLHGKDVLTQAPPSEIPETVKAMIARAKTLNEQHIEWHHHVLFPGCRFNSEGSKYSLVFEDPESQQNIVSASDTEPKSALSLIEPLFYAQSSK